LAAGATPRRSSRVVRPGAVALPEQVSGSMDDADFRRGEQTPVCPAPRPADVAPAEVDLRSFEHPVVEDAGEGLHFSGPLRFLEAVITEVFPPAAPFDRRRRPPAADVAGLVFLHREGDVVGGVDRWRRMTAGFSTLTAGAVIQRRQYWMFFTVWTAMPGFLLLNDSSAGNTGTPVITGRHLVGALRSLILLYMCVPVRVFILI